MTNTNLVAVDRADLAALKQYLDRHICHTEPETPEHVKELQRRVADILNAGDNA